MGTRNTYIVQSETLHWCLISDNEKGCPFESQTKRNVTIQVISLLGRGYDQDDYSLARQLKKNQ